VLRAIANLGLSLVLAVTLLFSGCLSPMAKSSCCRTSSSCPKAPVRQECTVQPAVPTAPADTAADVSLPIADVTVALAIPQPEDEGAVRPPTPRKSPPDLCLLNSVIRI
jgi:hypothetical protein